MVAAEVEPYSADDPEPTPAGERRVTIVGAELDVARRGVVMAVRRTAAVNASEDNVGFRIARDLLAWEL
jgi:hypothetical protein